MSAEPSPPAHPYLVPVALSLGGIANVFAWVDSIDTGVIISACTVAVPAIVGAAALALDKLGPALARFRKAWISAKDDTLAGKLDHLTEALDDVTRREAIAEKNAAVARRLADDAERLANVNKRLMDRSEAERATLADQLQTMAKRLEDANKKLHEISSPMQTLVGHARIAEQQQDEVIAKLDKTLSQAQANAGLTTRVDGKADHIAKTVDTIARKSGDDLPAFPGIEPPATS